jgi:hypothetical protein
MHIARVEGSNKGTKTTVHHIALGVDSKDQVYLISFESPSEEWEKNYEYGKPLLNYFILEI